MALQILMGASGHGKTYTLYKRLIDESLLHSDRRYILIVPEQSSLQAQKDIVRMHPNHGVFNIDVLTFGRLAYRVFDELGIKLSETIDDTGKNLIIRRIISEIGKDFKVLKVTRKQGIVSEIKSLISELKQYGITPDALDEIADKLSSSEGAPGVSHSTSAKICEINSIYKRFEEIINGKYTTVEDKPKMLADVLCRSTFFDGETTVAFDGFTGFTPVQLLILRRIVERAATVMVTVTMPDDEEYNVVRGESELFGMSKTMIRQCGQIADEPHTDMQCIRIQTDEGAYRFAKSSDLDFLEKELFRYRDAVYEGEPENIKLYRCDSISRELMITASVIRRLTQYKGIRYRDIAIITGDMNAYRDEAKRIFYEADIPVFIDSKRSILGNPLVEYIRSALKVINENYSYDSVMSYIKNVLSGFEASGVYLLENYILSLGIRGKSMWNKPFTYNYRGKKVTTDQAYLEEVNAIREEFAAQINELEELLKGNTGDMIKGLYEFLEKRKIYDRLTQISETLDNERHDVFLSIYAQVIELLDRIYSLQADEEITKQELAEELDAGFEEMKTRIIPVSHDCVILGDVTRSRLEHVKYMFVLGMNEGLIPAGYSNKGILSERERELIDSMGVELKPLPAEQIFQQNFYLYLNLTEPSDGLYIMYHDYDLTGSACSESRMLGAIRSMFPSLKEQYYRQIPLEDTLIGKKASVHILVDNLDLIKKDDTLCEEEKQKNNAEITKLRSLYGYYSEGAGKTSLSDGRGIFEIVEKMTGPKMGISGGLAELLYGDKTQINISEIENFSDCPYKHFAQYGLNLKERPLYEINNLDRGTINHNVLKYIGDELAKENKDFRSADVDYIKSLIPAAIDKACEEENAFFKGSNTNAYLMGRLQSILTKSVETLSSQMKVGDFVSSEYERRFKVPYTDFTLVGTIDRVDTLIKDGKVYVKIVDYKSGSKVFDYNLLHRGQQIQLPIYIRTYTDTMNDAQKDKDEPMQYEMGAMFYNKLDNPIIPEDDYNPAVGFAASMKANGVACEEIVSNIDNTYDPEGKADSGYATLKDKATISSEHFKLITDYAIEKARDTIRSIDKGVIEAKPYDKACMWCPYSQICGFDPANPENYRKAETVADKSSVKWDKFDLNQTPADDTEE